MFSETLVSDQAHSSIPQEDRIFEPFIGTWDLKVRWYTDGKVDREMAGEWSFSRVLEGRGIQDVWIVPPPGERSGDLYEYGTSVRYYEPGIRGWRSTWIGPMHDMVRTFVARRVGDEIVLQTEFDTDGALRWVFSEISASDFVWRNHIRVNGQWNLQQDFICHRRP